MSNDRIATEDYVDAAIAAIPPGGGSATWRDGSGAPSNGLGADGDYYLDDATGNVYLRTAGTYSIVANIKGATGATGAAGAAGAAGSNGTNGTNGTDGATGATGPAGPATWINVAKWGL